MLVGSSLWEQTIVYIARCVERGRGQGSADVCQGPVGVKVARGENESGEARRSQVGSDENEVEQCCAKKGQLCCDKQK